MPKLHVHVDSYRYFTRHPHTCLLTHVCRWRCTCAKLSAWVHISVQVWSAQVCKIIAHHIDNYGACYIQLQVETVKRTKLKNPNIFVSTTRLCVRNIPATVEDVQLRKVLMKAVADNAAKITEVHVNKTRWLFS